MRQCFLVIIFIFSIGQILGQGKFYPAAGYEFNWALNSYNEIFKFKKPEVNTKIQNGGGINIGVAYVKSYSFYPYFKTGFLLHDGLDKDSVFQNTNSYYKSHFILLPTYFGFQLFGRVGFSFELGADYIIGYHKFTGVDKFRTNAYKWGWNARITIGLFRINNLSLIFGIGQRYNTKFLNVGLFIPLPIFSSDSE